MLKGDYCVVMKSCPRTWTWTFEVGEAGVERQYVAKPYAYDTSGKHVPNIIDRGLGDM